MQWKNIIAAVGFLVVVSAVRMGKYPLFTQPDSMREALVKKVEAEKNPAREGQEYRGLSVR